MDQSSPRRTDEKKADDTLLAGCHRKLRELAQYAKEYALGAPAAMPWMPPEMRGYADSTLTLSVHKTVKRTKFAADQAVYMMYLGEQICPKILALDGNSYFMEYLQPAHLYINTLLMMETVLEDKVWCRDTDWMPCYEPKWRAALRDNIGVLVADWALDTSCVIHGDPTCDNIYVDKNMRLRIGDPIPPQWLNKPSIRAVDHGKMLQSLLGWELVLRGNPFIEYEWPLFMQKPDTAMRAIFWAMVALKRIAFRDMAPRVTEWAIKVAKELEELCM